jgi:hypothetical protein
MVSLTEADVTKILVQHNLTPGAVRQHSQRLEGRPLVVTSTPLQSTDSTTIARTIGVSYAGEQTKVMIIQKKVAKGVNVTIIPLTHKTLSKPMEFSYPDLDTPPPPPDATFSAGFWGWAMSFSEAEVQEIIAAAKTPEGVAVRAAIAALIGHFNWVAGLIVGLVLAFGPLILGLIDKAGGGKGMCFVDTWWGVFWIQDNPVPGGF